MKQLEIKKDGSVYLQPDNLFVENQMEGHHIVAKHHPETAINSTILCNPGIYPIPDLDWTTVDAKVARILSTDGKHKQMPLTGQIAILKESTPSTEQESQEAVQDRLWIEVIDLYLEMKEHSAGRMLQELRKQFTITRRKP